MTRNQGYVGFFSELGATNQRPSNAICRIVGHPGFAVVGCRSAVNPDALGVPFPDWAVLNRKESGGSAAGGAKIFARVLGQCGLCEDKTYTPYRSHRS